MNSHWEKNIQQCCAQGNKYCTCFCIIGLFNEADTLESSSMLIYSEFKTGLYTQWVGRDATLIKSWLNGD